MHTIREEVRTRIVHSANYSPRGVDPARKAHGRPAHPGCKVPGGGTSVFGSERLTGALLDRLNHHVHILELNGDSYRLKQSKSRRRRSRDTTSDDVPPGETVDPETGEVSS